jgi:hypothetical protein
MSTVLLASLLLMCLIIGVAAQLFASLPSALLFALICLGSAIKLLCLGKSGTGGLSGGGVEATWIWGCVRVR